MVTASATLGAVVGVFGVAFGVGAVSAGGSVAQACAMSLLVFTGASQFSAVSVIAAGGTTAAALGGAMLLAARNGVYGLAMSRILGGSLAARLVAAQLTIDESTAMATAQTEVAGPAHGVLDHRRVDLRVLEHRHAARRARRLGDRPADLRPRRRLPGRVRGHGRAAAAHRLGLLAGAARRR